MAEQFAWVLSGGAKSTFEEYIESAFSNILAKVRKYILKSGSLEDHVRKEINQFNIGA